MSRYIAKLKLGRAPGLDGIVPEHIKYATETGLPELLCGMLNACAQFGVLPKQFYTSALLPILKKPTLNPSEPNNYRPIMLSTNISKLLEYAILEHTTHEFSDSQYGFVDGRDTKMAVTTTVDVINYCNSRGSAVYACTLDAEKAFDAIPHGVLLYKTIGIIDNHWWRLLYKWYSNLQAVIKWNNRLSDPFRMERGTRQGGLTSPFMFNVIYQDVINDLCNTRGGIKIGNTSYNVSCYADDILLTSTTAKGLQKLIDSANSKIVNLGLSFNVKKTSCIVLGRNYLPQPVWRLNNCNISVQNNIDYLGATLCNDKDFPVLHVKNRISKCRKAFYSLQSAGMCSNGVEPRVISHLWKTALQPVLLYGDECFHLKTKHVNELSKTQSKLLKAALGLRKHMRSTPLLAALNVPQIKNVISANGMLLLNSIIASKSRAKDFYFHILRNLDNSCQSSLAHRCLSFCRDNDIRFIKGLFDKKYLSQQCKKVKSYGPGDGLIDSCRQLLQNYDEYNRYMLWLLLRPY